MSDTKSTKGANEPQLLRWRVSQTLTTPSSSPDASSVRCSSPRRVRRFTADLCAFVSRANGAPVATSVARMAQSEPPERRRPPPSTNASVRHDAPSGWHWMFFRRRVEDLSAS